MIVVKNKQCKHDIILKEYPNAEIFDVTSKVGAINEYDFGKGTPEIKSMWNTLDFEPGAGPFAQLILKNTNLENLYG